MSLLPKKIHVELIHQDGKVFWQCQNCQHLNVFGYQDCSECSKTFQETLSAQVVFRLERIGIREEYKKRTMEFMVGEMEAIAATESMDDKKLLWYLINTDFWKDFPCTGVDGALLGRLSDRLYPEYDGENVYSTETGWHTPEGEINYRAIAVDSQS
jgi:hypothetical protein